MLEDGLVGVAMMDLAKDQSTWSQATFGSDAHRGPLGGLKHLAKEANEAILAYATLSSCDEAIDPMHKHYCSDYHTELADILIILLDVSRRSGLTPLDLIRKAQAKMEVNKQRKWNVPQGDEPTEHVRDEK